MEEPPVKIAYANVYVTDLARSIEFFENTLGMDLQHSDPQFGYASFDAGPIRMGVAQIDSADADQRRLAGRQTGLGFAVADLKARHAELATLGVVFSMEPSKQPWGGFMAMFEDPDGNTFYLDEIAGG
jgi:catechol 2,3-dioxygenase-like lactoylglutathione lyase family enzyme